MCCFYFLVGVVDLFDELMSTDGEHVKTWLEEMGKFLLFNSAIISNNHYLGLDLNL